MFRELNIRILSGDLETPCVVHQNILENDLLKDYRIMKPKKIMSNPTEGTATGLFAITTGGGGILHIEIKHCHTQRTDTGGGLELTGNLGKIMQESIRVAHTAIWNILSKDHSKNYV